jgi:hypothetical protein
MHTAGNNGPVAGNPRISLAALPGVLLLMRNTLSTPGRRSSSNVTKSPLFMQAGLKKPDFLPFMESMSF